MPTDTERKAKADADLVEVNVRKANAEAALAEANVRNAARTSLIPDLSTVRESTLQAGQATQPLAGSGISFGALEAALPAPAARKALRGELDKLR